jgi:hypothetical protein
MIYTDATDFHRMVKKSVAESLRRGISINLLIFEKIMSVIASVRCEAISRLLSSFIHELGLRLLRQDELRSVLATLAPACDF